MSRRGRPFSPFLTTTSLAALLLGGAASPAYAACIYSDPFSISNAGTIATDGIVIPNRTTGNGTAFGEIGNANTEVPFGGITIDHASSINGNVFPAIAINGLRFAGGINNAGPVVGFTGVGGAIASQFDRGGGFAETRHDGANVWRGAPIGEPASQFKVQFNPFVRAVDAVV